MNGIKRNCINLWVTAHERLWNDGSDTTSGLRFIETGRTTGGTAILVLLSRVFPKAGYFLHFLLDFILGPDKT